VKTYNLIFSDHFRYRVARHLIFWLVLWVYFLVAYWFPVHWFPGWHPQGKVLTLAQNDISGFISFILRHTTHNILMQLFFTYTLIYFLLPKFLLKGKYIALFAGIVITLALLIIYKYNQLLNNFYTSIQPLYEKNQNPDKAYLFRCAWENVMFNCPTAGGIALSIKLLKYWYLKLKETQEVAASKAKAELQLLKAKVHPHFLFNTLNNIYSFTLNGSPKAPEMIDKLSGLLRYIINECDQAQVPLKKEILMIQDYMSLEKIRYGEEMDMTIDITGDYADKIIAPLLVIPFVENSFKHGASKMLSKPSVNLNIIIENQTFYFMLSNSRPQEYINPHQNGGIGLGNVQKRLELLYPGKHELSMTAEPEHFTVLLQIELQPLYEKASERKTNKEIKNYEVV
jgi:hypothetical protein